MSKAITLSDGEIWREGNPVFWFTICQKLDELGYESRLYSEVPSKSVMAEKGVHFVFTSRFRSQYGYFSSYQSAVVAMSNALKQAYNHLHARHLETLRAIEAENKKRQIHFYFQGETRIFNRDEVEEV